MSRRDWIAGTPVPVLRIADPRRLLRRSAQLHATPLGRDTRPIAQPHARAPASSLRPCEQAGLHTFACSCNGLAPSGRRLARHRSGRGPEKAQSRAALGCWIRSGRLGLRDSLGTIKPLPSL